MAHGQLAGNVAYTARPETNGGCSADWGLQTAAAGPSVKRGPCAAAGVGPCSCPATGEGTGSLRKGRDRLEGREVREQWSKVNGECRFNAEGEGDG